MLSTLDFVVISPESNFALLRLSVNYLRCFFPDNRLIVVLPEFTQDERLKSFSCEVIHGRNTVTSLINEGVKKTKDWSMVMLAGGMPSYHSLNKYLHACKSNKDILFPVVNRKIYFDEGSINGICLNRNVFQEVGDLPEIPDIYKSKLVWSSRAIEKGYTFKGIVGYFA